jgi:hypothetical protein
MEIVLGYIQVSIAASISLVIWLYAFWLLYLVVMGAYRAHLSKRLSLTALFLLMPFVLIGALVDILSNLLIAPVLFLDLPKELLVTTRLTRYRNTDIGWRNKVANYICSNLLDVFDPRGTHC